MLVYLWKLLMNIDVYTTSPPLLLGEKLEQNIFFVRKFACAFNLMDHLGRNERLNSVDLY